MVVVSGITLEFVRIIFPILILIGPLSRTQANVQVMLGGCPKCYMAAFSTDKSSLHKLDPPGSGIQAIPTGQMEAGRSLGLTYLQTMVRLSLAALAGCLGAGTGAAARVRGWKQGRELLWTAFAASIGTPQIRFPSLESHQLNRQSR